MQEQIYYDRSPWLITNRRLEVRGTMYVLRRIFAVRLRIEQRPGMFLLWFFGLLLLPTAFATTVYWVAVVAATLMLIGAMNRVRQPLLEIQLADGRWQMLAQGSYAELSEIKSKLEAALLEQLPALVSEMEVSLPSLLKR